MNIRISVVAITVIAALLLSGCGENYKWDTDNSSKLEGKYETRDRSLDLTQNQQVEIAKSMTQRLLYANKDLAGITMSIRYGDASTVNFAYGCAKLKPEVEASGILNYEAGHASNCEVPLTTEHRLKLGSLTKTAVGRTILDIDDDSSYDFSIEDQITKHLPADILALGDLSGITVRDLLYHTSGLSNQFDFVTGGTAKEIIKRVLEIKRAGKPGQFYQYNNSGYVILGQIIQHVTKAQSWEGEVQKRMNTSLGYNSFIFPEAANPNWIETKDTSWMSGKEGTLLSGENSLATGYAFSEHFIPVIGVSGADIANSAGSMIGTVPDVNKWMHNLGTNDGGLLSSEYFKNIITDGTFRDDYLSHLTWNMGPGLGYEQNQNTYFHLGSFTGYTCVSIYSKNEKTTLSVCTNGMTGLFIDFPYEVLNAMYPYRAAYLPQSSTTSSH